jgi:energy-converting hydrogenase Eha subunit C
VGIVVSLVCLATLDIAEVESLDILDTRVLDYPAIVAIQAQVYLDIADIVASVAIQVTVVSLVTRAILVCQVTQDSQVLRDTVDTVA